MLTPTSWRRGRRPRRNRGRGRKRKRKSRVTASPAFPPPQRNARYPQPVPSISVTELPFLLPSLRRRQHSTIAPRPTTLQPPLALNHRAPSPQSSIRSTHNTSPPTSDKHQDSDSMLSRPSFRIRRCPVLRVQGQRPADVRGQITQPTHSDEGWPCEAASERASGGIGLLSLAYALAWAWASVVRTMYGRGKKLG